MVVSTVSTDGVLADLDLEGESEVILATAKREWVTARLPSLMFGSDQVVSTATLDIPWFDLPGIYFIVWRDRVVYVGQASHIGSRVEQHVKEGRPIDRMAFIVGLPAWALDEIEHAYIRAWSPPWNAETRRCGALDSMPELLAAAHALDRSKVAEWHPPKITAAHARWKTWQLHVLGWLQANEPMEATDG